MKFTSGLGALGISASGLINSWSIALFDLPLTVVGMAAAGSMLSFAYNMEGDKDMSRRKLYFLSVANAVFAVCITSILPDYMGWGWYSPKMEGVFALLLAAVARFAIPVGLKLFPELGRKLLRLGEYKRTPEQQTALEVREAEAKARPKRKVKKDV